MINPEKQTERFKDKVLESNFALWNSLLTLNGVVISVFSAVALFDNSTNQVIIFPLVICCALSSYLLIANYNDVRNLYRQLGRIDLEEFKGKSEKEKENELDTAVKKHNRINHRELWVKRMVLLEAFLILLLLVFTKYTHATNKVHADEKEKEIVLLGKWNEKQLDNVIHKGSQIRDLGERIDFLSGQFLNASYKESTLIGSINTGEVFVINLEGMDCFTYIDYVEAMRLSSSFSEFKENLRRVRYKSGNVAFQNRNHFFTDWREFNSGYIDDVTKKVAGEKTKTVVKVLNRKENGTYFLPGIPVKERKIEYIPSNAFDRTIIEGLRTGDYVGIYSDMPGLDVSHTGIIVKDRDKVYLRHASSREGNGRVVDEDLINYISNKPGLVVLRPK
jgi:N-acetylmuramoyl-L-alanine amidase-like protein